MRFEEPACSRVMNRGNVRPANTGRFKLEEPAPDRIEQGRTVQSSVRGNDDEKGRSEVVRAER
ncbi:MAG: hypothetical protein AB1529_07520 [Candidatus Micrarchaeota archaeon]